MGGFTEFSIYSSVIAGEAHVTAWPRDLYEMEGKRYNSAGGYARAWGGSVLEAIETLMAMPNLDVRENIPPLSGEDIFTLDYISRWLTTGELDLDIKGKSVDFKIVESSPSEYLWVFGFAWEGSIVNVSVRNEEFCDGCVMGYYLIVAAVNQIREGLYGGYY